MADIGNESQEATRAFFDDARGYWRLMSAYERFEEIVVYALSLVIAVVVVIALYQLFQRVLPLVIGGALNPLNHAVFQQLFGEIFTVLIALEFKHSIIRAAMRRDSIVQVRTVLLIALLAISRKFVILDLAATSSSMVAALSGTTVGLGAVYWLLSRSESPGPKP
jgi:uncharacterized membrane protein (DUF373 family)